MATPEGRVKAKVNKLLAHYGADVYRFMPVQAGYGEMTLDYLVCVRGEFVAIETKANGKKLTERQQATAQRIRAAGGQVFEVLHETDLTELQRYLESRCADAVQRPTDAKGTRGKTPGSNDA